MDSIRQNKVGRLIQRDLSEMFQKECKEFTVGAMLSVTAVRVSPDMSYARVYLSIFPSNLTDKVLESLAEKNKSIRFILGKKIESSRNSNFSWMTACITSIKSTRS